MPRGHPKGWNSPFGRVSAPPRQHQAPGWWVLGSRGPFVTSPQPPRGPRRDRAVARSLEISGLETSAEVEVVIPAVHEGHDGGIWARSGFRRCPPAHGVLRESRASPGAQGISWYPKSSPGTQSILWYLEHPCGTLVAPKTSSWHHEHPVPPRTPWCYGPRHVPPWPQHPEQVTGCGQGV